MTLRNPLNVIADLSDLSNLNELVVDKRRGQRSSAKKNRRNRHYEKQFIRNSLAHHLPIDKVEQVLEEHNPPGLIDEVDNI
ncbi:MAG: hypothetical protein ACK5AJ_01785 [bacterium]|jgi:hypothetical protein